MNLNQDLANRQKVMLFHIHMEDNLMEQMDNGKYQNLPTPFLKTV